MPKTAKGTTVYVVHRVRSDMSQYELVMDGDPLRVFAEKPTAEAYCWELETAARADYPALQLILSLKPGPSLTAVKKWAKSIGLPCPSGRPNEVFSIHLEWREWLHSLNDRLTAEQQAEVWKLIREPLFFVVRKCSLR